MWRLHRRIHISWLIALLCALFVVGVAIALVWRVHFIISLLAIATLIYSLIIRRVWVIPQISVAALLLGVGYGSAHYVERSSYGRWFGATAQVSGRVKEDPSRSGSGSLSLQLEAVIIDGRKQAGVIFASVRGRSDIKRGDIVSGDAQVKQGFANFPASALYISLSSVTRTPLGDVGRVVRDWFADKVRTLIPEPQASLGIGFLTGQKSALPEELSESLKIAGLTHIVVASGYNLTILVRMARKLFLRLSKYLSALSAAIMIISFVAITGLSPSMTRAGLVSGMSLLAWYYGHAFHPFILLPVAAAITVAVQPSYVWGDLGWQLSFSAFAGVMIVAPLLQRYFFGDKEPGTLRQILGETIAAHTVTVPLIALSFGTISNVAIIANLLVVPLVPLAMLLTFLCGLGAIFTAPFVEVISYPTSWLLTYMTSVATFVSNIPWAQSELLVPGIVWIGYVAALIIACWWMQRKPNYNFRGDEVLQC